MEFKRLIRSRFADPLTAIDLSNQYVCHGSAMGRIAFYDILKDQELVLFDSQPELIRGISHSADGESIYISIGDVSCQKLDATTLQVKDNVLIVEDVDERQHKSNCERSYTMLHQSHNCVLTINMPKDSQNQLAELAPINISNLEENMLIQHSPDNLRFTQQHVPFDFDGENLLYMEYMPNQVRHVYVYNCSTREVSELLRFGKADPIVSHVKLVRSASNSLMLVYVQGGRQIKAYDVAAKKHMYISRMPDSILALHVRQNKLRPCDRNVGGQQVDDAEAQQELSVLMISAVDDSENVYVFYWDQSKAQCNVRTVNIKRIKQGGSESGSLQSLSLANKHFFGMGYPYFICGYGNHVAVTTDYGILLFQVEPSAQPTNLPPAADTNVQRNEPAGQQ